MNEAEEAAYIRGSHAAFRSLLDTCLEHLPKDDRTAHQWRLERAAAVTALRELCASHGDNNWPDELHLGDVIEKHLGRHLGQ